ncbi:hypothetical protein CCP3SC15_5090002 [Gammaproteobacteria bacterium]
MIFRTLVDSLRSGYHARRKSRIEAAVKTAVSEYFARQPEAKQARALADSMAGREIDETILRRFVQSCPPDRVVEIDFANGSRVIINGQTKTGGPGW